MHTLLTQIAYNHAGSHCPNKYYTVMKRVHLSHPLNMLFACIVVVFMVTNHTYSYGQALSKHQIDSLILYGNNLHDMGDFDGALTAYAQVYEVDSTNCIVLYEMGMTYLYMQKVDSIIRYARAGLRHCDDRMKPTLLSMIASAYDYQGKPEEALRIYRTILDIDDALGLVPYNMAITFFKIDSVDSAMHYVRQQIERMPNHVSSHVLLGRLHARKGSRGVAMLAFSKALLLEPKSERSAVILEELFAAASGGVMVVGDTTQIAMHSYSLSDTSEKFTPMDMMLQGAVVAVAIKDQKIPTTMMQKQVEIFNTLFASCSTLKESGGFVGTTYVPMFTDLYERKFTQEFVAYLFQGVQSDEHDAWRIENAQKMLAFKEWLKKYQ